VGIKGIKSTKLDSACIRGKHKFGTRELLPYSRETAWAIPTMNRFLMEYPMTRTKPLPLVSSIEQLFR
jgi:hypothetical protein